MMFITVVPPFERPPARMHAQTNTQSAAPVYHPNNLAPMQYARVFTNMNNHLTNLALEYCIDYCSLLWFMMLIDGLRDRTVNIQHSDLYALPSLRILQLFS